MLFFIPPHPPLKTFPYIWKSLNRMIMKAERQQKEAISHTIQCSSKGGVLKFVDNRQKDILGIKNTDETLQCYTKNENQKISNATKYITDSSSYIWVKKSIDPPIPDLLVQQEIGINYTKYTYNAVDADVNVDGNFVNDCGWLATFLAVGNRDSLGLQIGGIPLLLGKDAKNKDTFRERLKREPMLREQFKENERANPGIREAYFMGRTGTRYGGCNYHAATVIAKDQGDNITCEADAGSKLEKPVFDMYGTVEGQTFYEDYLGSYSTSKSPGITAVAKPTEGL